MNRTGCEASTRAVFRPSCETGWVGGSGAEPKMNIALLNPFQDPDSFKAKFGEIFTLSQPGATRLSIQRQQHLYTSGDIDLSIYYVESGSVRVTAQSADG